MRKGIWIAGLAALLLSACVSTEKFEASEASLASCQASLASCRTDATAQAERCSKEQRQQQERTESVQRESEARLAAVGRDLGRCQQEAATARASVKAMDERAAQLRQQLQAEIAAKNVEIEELRDQLSVRVLDRILFRSGSADILPAGRAVLDKLAEVFASSDDHIRVEGHTDVVPIGTALQARYPTNWELSTARASAVVRYFETARQIDPLRLEAVGYSKYRPVAPGDSVEALQRNRRVEIVLTEGKPR